MVLFDKKPGRRWAEIALFASGSVVGWILFIGLIGTGYWLRLVDDEILLCAAIPWITLFICGFAFRPDTEAMLPITQQYWFKILVWHLVFGFINTFYNHCFLYDVLDVEYTWPKHWHRHWFNNVPILLFPVGSFVTLMYSLFAFPFYRNYVKSTPPRTRARWARFLLLDVAFSYGWSAFMFWCIIMEFGWIYTMGSFDAVFSSYGWTYYALPFALAMPMSFRIDEGNSRWLTRRVIAEAAVCGLFLVLLGDASRILLNDIINIHQYHLHIVVGGKLPEEVIESGDYLFASWYEPSQVPEHMHI